MTEIKIEKKKTVWPWILLGLAILAVIIYFVVYYDFDEKTNEEYQGTESVATDETEQIGSKETNLIEVKENNSTVAAYVNFVDADKDKMGLHHAYTNEALLKLTAAINAMADEVGYDVRADIEKVKEHAENITLMPFETTHANSIRKASDILTNVLQNIQKAKYPGLTNEVAELRKASESINPDVLTLEQRNEVKTFFRKASELLKKMN
jgi:hypothetical protein